MVYLKNSRKRNCLILDLDGLAHFYLASRFLITFEKKSVFFFSSKVYTNFKVVKDEQYHQNLWRVIQLLMRRF